MDRFDAMRIFTRVAERRSFTLAADDLGVPRSTVTDAVKHLERRLGVRLLERTTRVVRPTLDGEAYYQRCIRLIADLEDAEAGFSGAKPSGLLRVDVHGTQARYFLLPGLPDFLARYPGIRLHLSEIHQPLDMVREGFDCIVRAGTLTDSSLYYRKLAEFKCGTFASPDYLARFGTPRTLDDLANGHRMMGLLAPDTPSITPLAFTVAGKVQELMLPMVVTVTGPDTNLASACAGLGIVQVPRYRVVSELAKGTLVELLADCPPPLTPVHALYSHTRQLSPRLRVFIDWLEQQYRTRDAP
ncbi:LysR family transcriptional regulator [Manganibacter manganicus]|uniref:Transcriptional regulator n=1 Tax=Manganibacter manganicus TaxID=1873176 RepID=A0A1V8RM70_9HYPH|nr:LysR family transcriptional regulator [Pseudaminobacter manganicus]OQM74059.1 transcriptional regulator [Pseudaminobacter manganicus]